MVQIVRSGSPDDAGTLGALAQQLAQALRTSRLTVVVGAAGAGKSTLISSLLPLLRRRALDVASAASAAPGVVLPFPDRRGRGADGAQRERIHTMDHWDDASLQSLQRALDDNAPGRGRRPVADAMTPGSLAAHIERHRGARLLFVFDHFDELLEAARGRAGHRRLIETWAAAVRSPQLRANFLVAVDERSWPWLHAVCVDLPQAHWSALRLHAPFGQRALEPMARPQTVTPALARRPLGIAPRPGSESTGAEFLQSVNDRMRRVAQTAREQHARNDGFAASVPHFVKTLGPRVADKRAPAEHTVEPMAKHRAEALAPQPEQRAPLPLPEATAPAVEAEVSSVADERGPTEHTVEPIARDRAEASAPQTEQPAALPQPQAAAPAAQAEAPRAPRAPPAAPKIEHAAPPAPIDTPTADPDNTPIDPALEPVKAAPLPRRRPMPALLGLAALVIGAGIAAWVWRTPAETPPDAAAAPAVAAAPQATPAPAVIAPAPPSPAPQPAPPPVAAVAPAATAAYDVIGVSANGEHARIARELNAALPSGVAPPRIEPLARDVNPVAWLQQAPGRLGIAHWDALRAAPQGGQAVPLRVLTPLFAEPVLFIVRADSPLRTIRQLRGQRISVGPAHSDAAHTVREIYRRRFGAPLTNTTTLAPDEAIAELVAFRSIDAMAVVDAQPMAWWSALDPAVARRLRVLTLDPSHPQDQRLLDSLGTAPLRTTLPGNQGGAVTVPAVMSYLVASGDVDAGAERLTAIAQALCRELPQLQKQGHPAWRGLRPRAQLDTGWPVAQAFRSTVSRCVRGG